MNNENSFRRLIVIGASAGGLEPLKRLVAGLGPELPVAVLVVQHLAPDSPRVLPTILERAGSMPVAMAADGDPIVAGQILLAPPNHHLVVQPDGDQRLAARVTKGPRENRARPSIDVLFRSAAVACDGRTIGVLLSGMLSDGVRGLQTIQRCGGVTVVQEPEEAAYPDMVNNALATIEVDYQLPVDEITGLLNRLAHTPLEQWTEAPDELRQEAAVNLVADSDLAQMKQIGQAITFSCPDCGGRLWQSKATDGTYYMCEVGHGFNAHTLLDSMDKEVERSLWVALRTLEERVRMLQGMAADAKARGLERAAADFRDRAAETEHDAQNIRRFLLGSAR
jgi:two-component system chemotaxis response regulator CheB